jgi:hypothetical protein
MSDTIRDDAHEWRQLCQAAFLELDPVSLLQRIAAARSAVFDRIEDRLSRPPDSEECALRNALETLSTLRELAERDLGQQKKTAQIQHLAAGYARNPKRESCA